MFSGFHYGRPLFHDESCIGPDLCEEYINKGQIEGLLPVLLTLLRHKSFAQNFYQGHTLNGWDAQLASNLDAKVGLFILADPR